MKQVIANSISEISPKNLLNVLKDISEEATLDQEFWNTIEGMTDTVLAAHQDPEKEMFHSQFISILVNLQKKKESFK